MQSFKATCIKSVDKEILICNSCNGNCVKNGKTGSDKQRFRCRQCGKSCLKEYTNNACHHYSNKWICRLLKEGCGIRSIGRLLEIAVATVMKRIKSIAACIKKPPVALGRKYQLDEIRTFVKCKDNLIWIAYAIQKDTKKVVDFNIGKRTNNTLRTVVSTLVISQAKTISTDRLKNYKYLIPKKIHRTNVYGINHIERMNLNIRTHLKRLNRRTICFSRSMVMLSACLKIYFWG